MSSNNGASSGTRRICAELIFLDSKNNVVTRSVTVWATNLKEATSGIACAAAQIAQAEGYIYLNAKFTLNPFQDGRM